MNIDKMTIEELEQLSHNDIAEAILKKGKKPLKTNDLFKKVCKLLGISDDEMLEMIGDFYTALMTDKRFILLNNAKWDLRELHKVNVVMEDDEEEDDVSEDEEEEETEEGNEEEDDSLDNDYDDPDDDDPDDMDDLDELSIVTEDEMDEE